MTSRAAGDVLLSLSGRVDCAGLSGNPPPVVCAAIIGAQEMLMKKARVHNDCFNAWLIEFLDAVLWCGYATGCGTRISGGYCTVFCGVSSLAGSRNGLPLNSPVTVRVGTAAQRHYPSLPLIALIGGKGAQ